jgi:hypothetical protein
VPVGVVFADPSMWSPIPNNDFGSGVVVIYGPGLIGDPMPGSDKYDTPNKTAEEAKKNGWILVN